MFGNLNETHYLLIIVSAILILYVVYWFQAKTRQQHQQPQLSKPQIRRPTQTSSPQFVLYNFYSPMCGYCKQFMPTWDQLRAELRDNLDLELRTINATDPQNERITFYYNVNKYPTIILVTPGKNIEYVGNRTVDDIKDFLRKYMKDN